MGKFIIEIWTDGSVSENPGGIGGWCAIIVARKENVQSEAIADAAYLTTAFPKEPEAKVNHETFVATVRTGREDNTTNNRMEMRAIIEGVKTLTKPTACTVFSDSMYAINSLTGKHKAKANLDLISEWKLASVAHRVAFRHVRGHSGNPINAMCDLMAKEAREKC